MAASWFTRLVVATLYTFGLKRGVGAGDHAASFSRVCILRGTGGMFALSFTRVMQTLEAALLETAEAWEKDGARG